MYRTFNTFIYTSKYLSKRRLKCKMKFELDSGAAFATDHIQLSPQPYNKTLYNPRLPLV